jgi:hypothetical protein
LGHTHSVVHKTNGVEVYNADGPKVKTVT